MRYLNLEKNQQNLFLKQIKTKIACPWKQIAKILNVDRSMVYFYLNEHSKLPYESYDKLCSLAKINPEAVKTMEIKNKQVEIKSPPLNELFSEFLGALAGDGHVNKINYEVSISMDKDLDGAYCDHITQLFKKLFNIHSRRYVQKNKVKCFVYSKELVNFLSENYKIPVGKKKGRLHIPLQVKSNKNLLKAYIRGVFDTDGSFNRHHLNDAMVGIACRDKIFMEELKNTLQYLNFTASHSNKNLYIYQKKEIDRFFKEIKPSNMKHIKKYLYYKQYGRVPLTRELINR